MSDKDSSSSGEVVEVPGNIEEDEGKWKVSLENSVNFSGESLRQNRTSL